MLKGSIFADANDCKCKVNSFSLEREHVQNCP